MSNKEASSQMGEAIKQVKMARNNVYVDMQAKVQWHLENALGSLESAKKEVDAELEG